MHTPLCYDRTNNCLCGGEQCYRYSDPCDCKPRLAGGRPVIIETHIEEGFKLSPEKLRKAITDKTKALILSYPNNPTGACMSRDELMEIRNVLADLPALLHFPEVYLMAYDCIVARNKCQVYCLLTHI